ncbi:MAG TPA: chemotaxis protein CheA [Bacteroidales bacterium]|nr:chemotaxis protein CheA [Bacteroidales bacterium]
MDMNQLKLKFIDEAESLLTSLDNVLIELEKTDDLQNINEAFRVMHTIKGASGMFGFDKIVEITHELESIYDLLRQKTLQLNPSIIDITFTAADHIRALLIDEAFSNENNIKRHKLLKESIDVVKGIKTPESKKTEPKTTSTPNEIKVSNKPTTGNIDKKATWNILFYPNEELIKRCVNMAYTFHDLFALGEYKISSKPFNNSEGEFWSIFLVTDQPFEEIENALMFVMDYCKISKVADFDIFNPTELEKRDEQLNNITQHIEAFDTTDMQNNAPNNANDSGKELIHLINKTNNQQPVQMTPKATTRINVEASKLDTLMYLVSELVTTKSELLIALKKHDEEKSIDAAEKIEKLSKLFSDNALSIRMVSLHEMLNKFKRLIRDLAKQLGKQIEFEIIGEDTELDKNIIDAIGEPIMHLIRNCIDHGIEIPEKRIAKGKPETGTIKFEAQKTGNYVYITISDDGNGINTEYVYNKAVDKGFIQPGTNLTEKEIMDLIFLPGFSTAESLSNVSGRGIGMDIVLKRIHDIRGEIIVSSTKNIGTAFTLKLQQTVSIISTLLVTSGKTTYAIPIEDIEACNIELDENTTNTQSKLIRYNNELLPFYILKGYTMHAEDSSCSQKLIIINKQSKRYAIIADTIIGEYQAVIKPLGKAFSEVKHLSGASLLGDGSIALLLDTDNVWFKTSNN